MSNNLMPVQLLEWKPVVKDSLRGFAKIQLGALLFHSVGIFRKGEQVWASLPSKPLIGERGPIRDAQGKQRYQNLVTWATKESHDRFSASVAAAIEEQYPGATL